MNKCHDGYESEAVAKFQFTGFLNTVFQPAFIDLATDHVTSKHSVKLLSFSMSFNIIMLVY